MFDFPQGGGTSPAGKARIAGLSSVATPETKKEILK
jgi:hypothetical protein